MMEPFISRHRDTLTIKTFTQDAYSRIRQKVGGGRGPVGVTLSGSGTEKVLVPSFLEKASSFHVDLLKLDDGEAVTLTQKQALDMEDTQLAAIIALIRGMDKTLDVISELGSWSGIDKLQSVHNWGPLAKYAVAANRIRWVKEWVGDVSPSSAPFIQLLSFAIVCHNKHGDDHEKIISHLIEMIRCAVPALTPQNWCSRDYGHRWTMLETAVQYEDTSVINQLLEAGYPVGAVGGSGASAYLYAVRLGSTEAMSTLCQWKDMTMKSLLTSGRAEGWAHVYNQLYFLADSRQRTAVFQLLLSQLYEKFIGTENTSGTFSETIRDVDGDKGLLHMAAERNDLSLLQAYHNFTGDITNCTGERDNYLHCAARKGSLDVLMYDEMNDDGGHKLLVDQLGAGERSVLDLICDLRRDQRVHEIVLSVLPHVTWPSDYSVDCTTPMHSLARLSSLPDSFLQKVKKILQRRKDSVQKALVVRDCKGHTPLHLFVKGRQCRLMDALGCDLPVIENPIGWITLFTPSVSYSSSDQTGDTPLHHAIQMLDASKEKSLCDGEVVQLVERLAEYQKMCLSVRVERDDTFLSPMGALVEVWHDNTLRGDMTEEKLELHDKVFLALMKAATDAEGSQTLTRESTDISRCCLLPYQLIIESTPQETLAFKKLVTASLSHPETGDLLLSPLDSAIDYGLTQFIEVSFSWLVNHKAKTEGGPCCSSASECVDVTDFIPATKPDVKELGAHCQPTVVEQILMCEQWHMLELPLLKALLKSHWRPYFYLYNFFLFIHILNMVGVSLWTVQRFDEGPGSDVDQKLRGVGSIWPFLLFLFSLVHMTVLCVFKKSFFENVVHKLKKHWWDTLEQLFPKTISILFFVSWLGWLHTNTTIWLSVSLALGWMMCLQFLDGMRQIHHYNLAFRQMIVRDIFRFGAIACFLIVGCGYAIFTLTRGSCQLKEDIDTPGTAMLLMFRWAIGAADFFENISRNDSEHRCEGDDVTLGAEPWSSNQHFYVMRGFYIFYMILLNLALLNMLIAILSNSFSVAEKNKARTWLSTSVRTAIHFEQLMGTIPGVRNVYFCLVRRLMPGLHWHRLGDGSVRYMLNLKTGSCSGTGTCCECIKPCTKCKRKSKNNWGKQYTAVNQ